MVTFPSTARPLPNLMILEYSGVDLNNPVDVTAAAAGNGVQADTGFAHTTFGQDLLFAAGTTSGGFNAGAAGYTGAFSPVAKSPRINS